MRLAVLCLAMLLALSLGAPARSGATGSGTAPDVVVSIAPAHSLVARVMQGAGDPYLLLPPGASPHDHALRPSDAAALERAALVFWIGPRLEPWVERPLATLAQGARVFPLSDTPGITRLAPREGEAFEVHDSHANRLETGNGAAEIDPHLWLDPENAKLWLAAIAAVLTEADPGNGALYLANAEAARAEIDAVAAGIDARLAPVRGRPYVVFHDAFHYFENRFGISAAGAVALSDARAPGPARIAAIRTRIRSLGAVCLFREPQFRARLVDTVAEGTGIRIGVLDPLGSNLEPGPGLYPDLLRGLANSLVDCLG